MQKKKETQIEELYGELGTAFNFTHGDLEANRAGFITARQKHELRLRFVEQRIIPVSIILASTISLVIMGVSFPTYSRSTCGVLMALILLIITPLLFIEGWRVLASDLRDGKVQRLEGIAREIGVGKAWRKAFVVVENEVEFKLNRKQYRLTNGHGRFVIYTVPKSRKIVAIEEVLPE